MAQSIYQDKDYLIFDKYTKKLNRTIESMNLDDRDKHITNWLKGRARMEQLALKYKMELNKPYPIWARRDDIAHIKWIKSMIDGDEIVWGLWSGEDHTKIDGKHVFNETYLNFLAQGYKDKEKAKTMLAKLMAGFDGKVVR